MVALFKEFDLINRNISVAFLFAIKANHFKNVDLLQDKDDFMLYDTTRIRSGDMPQDMQAQVDDLLKEFISEVNALTEDRHLQKGIARSQLPCSIVVVLDKDKLSILAQLRSESRTAGYYINPLISLTPQKAAENARWEFGFSDAFVIQFPKELLNLGKEERRSALKAIASDHIDSEFNRFMSLIGLMRNRPIFGSFGPELLGQSALLLLPADESLRGNYKTIMNAAGKSCLATEENVDIRNGKTAVFEMWQSINRSGIIIADLTGSDPGVMYALGIAHTIGKNTVLICPQGSRYLTDIPGTHRIVYDDTDEGKAKFEKELLEVLRTILQPLSRE